ncbi:hypothetical protein [Rhodovulum adriaticum]|uniref:Uncharacterized protein n=1 Tax=Rhodovulum adriaticum TaxID=35804 RepID=A0A4R2NFF9_RHOAD|nr:hypothetical protein [Rhodovulum adriaticum]MBK1637306.1 hypothetical protein [Rhodovulum adriaticum]TCP19997.1 hypothetical protein EV656_1239 [Rhodovulum adriaticum]
MPPKFTHKGRALDRDTVSKQALELMDAIEHAERHIRQLESEWAIADTARLAYHAVLRREIRAQEECRDHG